MTKMGAAVVVAGFVLVAVLGVRAMMSGQAGLGATRTEKLPAPVMDEAHSGSHSETAVFAGGCFWGVQTTYERIKGVTATTAGYSGGTKETANYGAVSSETTGHAESVKVVFDPQKISYGTLLRVFFSVVHDPTQLNRQGPDWGSQYRSVVFTRTAEQMQQARAKIAELSASGAYRKPIVTKVEPATMFWKAEEYHQRYLEKRGMVHCHI
jgi:peptide-methionine (S)-S-oxide reductase